MISNCSICGRDRKRTRLNSSHGYISYAVFCLKKKWLQESDGFVRLHRWPASLRLPRRAVGETFARQERPGSRRPPPRTGKTRQAKLAPMKAMILAAGLGTRLRPLTDNRPKALVELSGRTLLEITLSRLRAFGVTEVIVNVHHFADMVIEYLKSNNNFGMRIEISREDVLLDTGGGLKRAAWFFLEDSARRDSSQDEPFLLHNVDVISNIDLRRMLQFHTENHAMATLAVQSRETSRYLLFDDHQLCGRRTGRDGTPEWVRGHLPDSLRG